MRAAEHRLGIAETPARRIRERRHPERVVHTLSAILRFRMFAIACGYEHADDCGTPRGDPLFKLAIGRAPESGRNLCSQPTMSQLESAPSRVEVARMTSSLVDIFANLSESASVDHARHRRQLRSAAQSISQLSLFNAHHDKGCFLPVHVYHFDSGRQVAVLLRLRDNGWPHRPYLAVRSWRAQSPAAQAPQFVVIPDARPETHMADIHPAE